MHTSTDPSCDRREVADMIGRCPTRHPVSIGQLASVVHSCIEFM